MKVETKVETKIKSNRLPLCGGQDISVGIRDKVLSVMERNRKRSITAMDLSVDDMKAVIARIVDHSRFSEFKSPFGKNLVTGFAKICV